jgi:hypothetical protein
MLVIIFGNCTNYEAPHHYIFSNLLSLHLSGIVVIGDQELFHTAEPYTHNTG